ncbi:hypothetical protein ACD591_12765 [Rufibacter glacialis]|uniref:Uncharacterized protein n=1 Tax=Rufibacter glacialis TaxID=1259555 RepID=A0ABV4RHY2_9BACT|nr:hypothetical protein [Rufibacter glacialis]
MNQIPGNGLCAWLPGISFWQKGYLPAVLGKVPLKQTSRGVAGNIVLDEY